MTVLGPVATDRLGVVLMHEHLLHDGRQDPCWFQQAADDPDGTVADAPVSMAVLGRLRRSPFDVRDNTRLTTDDPIIEELTRYRAAGGGTIVELTCRGLDPDPEGLAAISRAAAVHVVAGCGYYVDHVLPRGFAQRPVDDVAAELVADLRTGIDGGSVHAGIIGEVGTSSTITPAEKRSLHAAGQAAVETGTTVMVHLSMYGEQAFSAFAILASEGVPPDRIVMNHIDEAGDLDYARRVAELGCVVEYDTFGSEWYYDPWQTWEPRDTDRVAAVAALCRDGLAGQVTLAQDVFYKQSLHAYGGWGYDHLLTSVVPMLRRAGVCDRDLCSMLVTTPQRLLRVDDLDEP